VRIEIGGREQGGSSKRHVYNRGEGGREGGREGGGVEFVVLKKEEVERASQTEREGDLE